MSEAAPSITLARSWNFRGQLDHLGFADRLSAARWRHELRELPDTTIPANTICLLAQPAKSFRICGRKAQPASVKRGGIGLVAEGSDGRWQFEGPIDVFHFYISNAALGELAAREGGRQFSGLRDQLRMDDPVLAALAGEAGLACMEGPASALYASTLGLAMNLRLLRQHSNLNPSPRSRSNGGLAPWQLKRAFEAIDARLDGEISLTMLSDIVGVSPTHFSRAFKQSAGMPPFQWLLERRVERAKALLADPHLPLAEIALAVGFGAQPQFTTAFKRVTGVTPGVWRRKCRL